MAGQPAPEPAPAAEPAFQPLSYVVYFGFDSTTVTETGQATIERAATYALANAGTRVEVVGHTDRAGDPVYNDALAKKRSSAVAEALTKVGIPASLIKVDSRGESEPAEETAENEKSRLNRRVTILVTQ